MRSKNIIQNITQTSGICQGRQIWGRVLNIIIPIIAIFFIFLSNFGYAEIIDKVVAFIDEQAILLSEFDAHYKSMSKFMPDIKKEDVLNTMINRTLLLREAKRLRIEAVSKEDIIKEYIDLKLKTLIEIKESEMKDFYENNKAQFSKAEFDLVRGQIEQYLTEKEINTALDKQIKELRSKAYIKINLEF